MRSKSDKKRGRSAASPFMMLEEQKAALKTVWISVTAVALESFYCRVSETPAEKLFLFAEVSSRKSNRAVRKPMS